MLSGMRHPASASERREGRHADVDYSNRFTQRISESILSFRMLSEMRWGGRCSWLDAVAAASRRGEGRHAGLAAPTGGEDDARADADEGHTGDGQRDELVCAGARKLAETVRLLTLTRTLALTRTRSDHVEGDFDRLLVDALERRRLTAGGSSRTAENSADSTAASIAQTCSSG